MLAGHSRLGGTEDPMKSLESIWSWMKGKFGRIVSALGLLLSGVDTFDISPIKDPLEGFIGHRGVMGITVMLFLASYARHQYVASQHPKPAP